MRKNIFEHWIITIMLITIGCSIEKPIKEKENTSRWSNPQGKMSWKDAMDKCTSLGMRLPKSRDFVEGEENGETKSLEQKGYWTSEDVSENYAYSYNLENRNVIGTVKAFQWRVICIR
jgi:hypothetical protein